MLDTTTIVPANATRTPAPRAEQITRMSNAIDRIVRTQPDDNDGEAMECAQDCLFEAFMNTTHEDIVTRAVAALERQGRGNDGRGCATHRAKSLATIVANIRRYGRK